MYPHVGIESAFEVEVQNCKSSHHLESKETGGLIALAGTASLETRTESVCVCVCAHTGTDQIWHLL